MQRAELEKLNKKLKSLMSQKSLMSKKLGDLARQTIETQKQKDDVEKQISEIVRIVPVEKNEKETNKEIRAIAKSLKKNPENLEQLKRALGW